MNKKHKNEEVSISFHYLKREKDSDTEKKEELAFTKDEFEGIHQGLLDIKKLDVTEDEIMDELRFRKLAKIEKIEKTDNRTVTGIYKASYWGHSYENSLKGIIPADSLNLRPFFFMLYLSESGRIYLASQYLGNYGGYTAIKNSVISKLANKHGVVSCSFNIGNLNIESAISKEVEITYSRKSKHITGKNIFGKTGALSFRKENKNDGFESIINDKFLSLRSKPHNEIRKHISSLLKESNLMEINDDEIENCKVIALINGSRKVIQLLEGNNYATRFPVNILMNDDGHPVYETLKQEATKLLVNEIISRKEDV